MQLAVGRCVCVYSRVGVWAVVELSWRWNATIDEAPIFKRAVVVTTALGTGLANQKPAAGRRSRY